MAGEWFAVLKSGIPAAASAGCPRRDVDRGAGRADDATDDVDEARFALGRGIEPGSNSTAPTHAAGHAGDGTADFIADDATHLTAAHHDHDAPLPSAEGPASRDI